MKQYHLIIFDWQDTLMQLDGKLFPDVIDVLTELKSRGYLLAVATNAPRESLDYYLQSTKTNHLFDASRCANETALKPDPLMLNELLEELNIDAKSAVMIGDSETDMHMAKNAGMDAIAVNNKLKHAKFLSCFAELLDWFS